MDKQRTEEWIDRLREREEGKGEVCACINFQRSFESLHYMNWGGVVVFFGEGVTVWGGGGREPPCCFLLGREVGTGDRGIME